MPSYEEMSEINAEEAQRLAAIKRAEAQVREMAQKQRDAVPRKEPDQKIQVMEHAAQQIRSLRRALEIANAKIEMVYLMASIVPRNDAGRLSGGMEVDAAHQLDRIVSELRNPPLPGV